jgi:hypothetical protein
VPRGDERDEEQAETRDRQDAMISAGLDGELEPEDRERLRRIDELGPKERKEFARELRNRLAESPGETARIERNIDRWREMSESERESDREQMKRFRAMSVEDRRMLLDAWVGPEPAESFSGVVDESSKPSGQIRSSALGVDAFRLAPVQYRKGMIPSARGAQTRVSS